MQDFLKKYGIALIIIFVVSLVASYVVFASKGFIPTGDVNKSTWLSFWGGFLAFYGTVFLGLVSLWQNDNATKEIEHANNISEKLVELTKKANETNLKLLKIENSKYSCNVILKDNTDKCCILSNEATAYEYDNRKLYLNIKNHGEAVLKKMEIYFYNNLFSSHINLAKSEEKNIIINVPLELDCKEIINITFFGCNDLETYADFKLIAESGKFKIEYYNFYGLKKE